MIGRFVVVSPCRNEERFIELTLNSVVRQTRRPDRWIIVDDGSSDASLRIVERYAAEHPWIELLRLPDKGKRPPGAHEAVAFNDGIKHLGDDPYEVIAKLDTDLEFGSQAFAEALAHFDDERVGLAGGITYLVEGDKLVSERPSPSHVPGQAKFYRRACFEDIGGVQPVLGWDILDETDARRRGWRTVGDREIVFKTFRLQGARTGAVHGRYIYGLGAYAIGTHPLFAVARGIFRMTERPWIVGGLGFIWGFFAGYFHPAVKRIGNVELIRHLRREQLYRLFHGNRLPPEEG